MAEIILDDNNFETEVLASDIPVLVDFWAPWCGPCKMLGPVVSAVAEKYEGKIKVCKYNVDDSTEYAEKYYVENIPAIKIFRNGEIVNEALGFTPQPKLEALIEEIL
ncbi:MAG: thioredoxin [Clostridiales bacterium]|nr:thioredoxin [Clostridiales bacterium]